LREKLGPAAHIKFINYAKVASKDELCQVCLGAELIVTVGFEPTQATMGLHPKRPILSTLIRKNTYEALLAEYKHTADKDHQPNTTAVFLDQPLHRNLDLARGLLQNPKSIGTVGVLVGPRSQIDRAELEAAAAARGIKLHVAEVTPQQDPVNALNWILEDSQMILALPDPDIFNRRNARGLLMTALRHNVPVIAFSRAYVDMGALAALYEDEEAIAQQTVDKIMLVLQAPDATMPAPEYARDFDVIINEQLAQQVGFPRQGSQAIKQSVLQLEKSLLQHEAAQ